MLSRCLCKKRKVYIDVVLTTLHDIYKTYSGSGENSAYVYRVKSYREGGNKEDQTEDKIPWQRNHKEWKENSYTAKTQKKKRREGAFMRKPCSFVSSCRKVRTASYSRKNTLKIFRCSSMTNLSHIPRQCKRSAKYGHAYRHNDNENRSILY